MPSAEPVLLHLQLVQHVQYLSRAASERTRVLPNPNDNNLPRITGLLAAHAEAVRALCAYYDTFADTTQQAEIRRALAL